MKIKKMLHVIVTVVLTYSFLLTDLNTAHAVKQPNDRYFLNQSHLKQIKADRAWDIANSNTGITIAVLDSGVDRDHPDLKDNLLPGVNLVKPGTPPEDDNGHGTEVTGILAARGNNGIGATGVLWNARILPIKVLNEKGKTHIDMVAEGIEVAINRGAKIVLMSSESVEYSKALDEAVQKAEAKGVVLVAAAGNEQKRVAYPAAYPTVIAVGAVNQSNQPYYSNSGPELKLMAPGRNIYTTKMGGRYGLMRGTSAAAPQVAGAAALILAKYPKMTPLEVRQLLYQTAADLGEDGWDRNTGYGLLDLNRALRNQPSLDISEPNNSQFYAKPFPIESQIRAQLHQNDTIDWYSMDIPYDGRVTFSATVSTRSSTAIAATFYSDKKQPVTYYIGNGDTLTIPARQGKMYMKLERTGGITAFTYVLTGRFMVSPDRYERNDDMGTARPLVGNQISVIGNFHQTADEDWFSYYVRENGRLNIVVSPDTNRIDPKLFIGKQGDGWDPPYDNGTRSNQQEKVTKEVTPGKYYIRLREYSENAVNGEYRLDVIYTPVRKDTNEPNDAYHLASRLLSGYLMTGTLASKTDYDWFQFEVEADSYVRIRAPFIPVSSGVRLVMYNSQTFNYSLAAATQVAELSDQGREILGLRLGPGKYYIRLNSVVPFKYDAYRLILSKEKLIDGYRDIAYHWARTDIARLSKKGVVNGFADATFRPDAMVTRAQFATMLVEAMRAKGLPVSGYTGRSTFKDLSRSHWAYSNIAAAYRLGILKGYPNGTIKPNQPLTRAEMAAMVARAHTVLLYKRSESSYRDVPTTHWASPAIEALTSRGWLHGYSGDNFRPQAFARRAEMVVLLAKAYKL